MPRTIVVLPAVHDGVLPVAALPALRTARRVHADVTVLPATAAAVGAEPGEPVGDDWVLLTADLEHPAVASADQVIAAPRPPGAALLDAVAVMDRLRSPGGCPWDAEQTHTSLLQYLVEECYELYQAIEDGDGAAVREELGDVLLQVLFHARVAAEAPEELGGLRFDIDDVAADLVVKLVGRHPHVFAGTERIDTAERQEYRWDELKRAEKQRESSVDGVPLGQPAVALAAKLTSRTARAGLPADLLPAGEDLGERLFTAAARAKLAGTDPEAALRTAARRFADDIRAAERAARAAGLDPHALDAAAWRAHWPT
ncbi:MAG: nucleoside triphosphate diphosphatase [Pseudonocardiales bacterium]|nr:nucleoside triphosphate diphosphatase [Pseudonocardiales bacterium]